MCDPLARWLTPSKRWIHDIGLEPEVPVELERICMRCLSKDPACRFPTARIFADALRNRVKTGRADLRHYLGRHEFAVGRVNLSTGQPLPNGQARLSPNQPD